MASDSAAIGGRLIAWYRAHARELPWRGTRDPYAVWVSETMLQQTTVRTVGARWGRFLSRFPDVRALARATEADVLAEVQGLGYYRRFRQLKRAAEICVERFDGRTPTSAEDWRELPGVGPYMVGAVMSIAFDRPMPAVDGNVCRVLARLRMIGGDLLKPKARRGVEDDVSAMMRAGSPGSLTQALFDLGAGVCTPRDPSCLVCPLRGDCRAHREGVVDQFPHKKARPAMQDVAVAAAWIESKGRILIVRRPADASLMPDFWEAPAVWESTEAAAERALRAFVEKELGATIETTEMIASAKHVITKHRLTCRLYAAKVTSGKPPASGARIAWIDPAVDADRAGPLTSITTKLLRARGRAAKTKSAARRSTS